MKTIIRKLADAIDDEDAFVSFAALLIPIGALLIWGFIADWLWDAHWLLGAFAIVLPLVGIYKKVTRAPTHHDR